MVKSNQIQLAVFALCGALALSACHSNDDDTPSIQSTHTTQNKPTTPNNPSNTTSGNNTTTPAAQTINGVAVSANAKNIASTKAISSNQLKTLTVDGQSFNLDPYNGMVSAGTFMVTNDSITSGRHVSHVKYGRTGGANPTVYVQGENTKDMPTSGVVNYSGYAFVGTDADYNSSVKADFGSKSLSGSIVHKNNSTNKMDFTATINGNTFEGKDNKGGFYGAGAAEVAGIVIQNNQTAAFGASKK